MKISDMKIGLRLGIGFGVVSVFMVGGVDNWTGKHGSYSAQAG